MDDTLHCSPPNWRKRLTAWKSCEIRQKFDFITFYNSKLWAGFPNALLFWSPCQRGRAKRILYKTTTTTIALKLQFLKHCSSRIICIKQQKLALPISPTLDSYNGRQMILQTEQITACSVIFKQGHHHNGDQAARRPHTMWSICGRRYTIPRFVVRGGQGWAHSVARP